MQRRIPLGPIVAVAGAALLIVSLILDWYEELTGFTVFEALDLLLVALALATVAALAGELGMRLPGSGWPRAERSLAFAAVAAVIVVSQLLNDPPAVATELGPEKDLGIWLALAGAALMVAGSALGSARVALAVDVHGRGPARAPDEAPTAAEPAARPDETTTAADPATDPAKPPRPARPERP